MKRYPEDIYSISPYGGQGMFGNSNLPNLPLPKSEDVPLTKWGLGGGEFSWEPPPFGGGELNYTPPGVPAFHAPAFTAPDAVTMLNDPGYKFRLAQGEQALQNSAAARGVLRTGGTLKDILGYGQNFASSEYQNVFDRALQAYNTKYQAAKDQYAPYLLQWQTLAQIGEQNALANFNRLWDQYTFGLNQELAREQLVSGLANVG